MKTEGQQQTTKAKLNSHHHHSHSVSLSVPNVDEDGDDDSRALQGVVEAQVSEHVPHGNENHQSQNQSSRTRDVQDENDKDIDSEDDNDNDNDNDNDDDIISFTLTKFPGNKHLKDNSGLPWGCTLQPLAKNGIQSGRLTENMVVLSRNQKKIVSSNKTNKNDTKKSSTTTTPFMRSELVPRCSDCYGYLSRPCYVDRWGWRCCLCGCYNSFPTTLGRQSSSSYGRQYTQSASDRRLRRFERVGRCELYEMQSNVTELEVKRTFVSLDVDKCSGRMTEIRSTPGHEDEAELEPKVQHVWQSHADVGFAPMTLFLVDGNMHTDGIYELMVSSLTASLEALDGRSFVGFVLVRGSELCIVDLQSASASIGKNNGDVTSSSSSPSCTIVLRKFPLTLIPNANIGNVTHQRDGRGRTKVNDNDGATFLNSFCIEDCMDLESIMTMVSFVKLNFADFLKQLRQILLMTPPSNNNDNKNNSIENHSNSQRRTSFVYGPALTSILQLFESGICVNRLKHNIVDDEEAVNEETRPRYTNARVVSLMFSPPSGMSGGIDGDVVKNAVGEIKCFKDNSTSDVRSGTNMKSLHNHNINSTKNKSSSLSANKDADTYENSFESDLLQKVITEEELEIFDSNLSSKSSRFYSSIGKRAANIGVTCDCFMVNSSERDTYFDMTSIKHLPHLSGGTLMYYNSMITDSYNNNKYRHDQKQSNRKSNTCTLPGDMYRYLLESTQSSATNGSLRIRTSNEYCVAEHFGHLSVDDDSTTSFYETSNAIYNIPRCTKSSAYCFEFDFNSLHGFSDDGGDRDNSFNNISRSQYSLPLLQIAFQYDVYIPLSHTDDDFNLSTDRSNCHSSSAYDDNRKTKNNNTPSDFDMNFNSNNTNTTISSLLQNSNGNGNININSNSNGSARSRVPSLLSYQWLLVQRLRIITIQVDVCWSLTSPRESLYNFIDIPTTITMLFHKTLKRQKQEGSVEAKILLRDWLAVFVARYYYTCGIHLNTTTNRRHTDSLEHLSASSSDNDE